jgi:hypothetical protein
MDDTAGATAAPEPDDPLAANDPNPVYLAALSGALDLARECRVFDLARALANPRRADLVSALLCHELASCHRLMMRFGAMADHYLNHTSPTVDPDRRQVGRDALGFAAIAARLMARYREGALALPKLRSEVDVELRKIVVDWGNDDDGPGGGTDTDPTPAKPAEPVGTPDAAIAAPLRRGRLKNGNPSGDYLNAPRCGATTRAGGACRQPAMTSPGGGRGRCRLHGGKSTGARTADGRRRVRTARLVHGRRSAEAIGLRSAAAAVSRRLAWMSQLARQLSAGHGVDRSDSPPPLGRAAAPKPPDPSRVMPAKAGIHNHRRCALDEAAAAGVASLAPDMESIAQISDVRGRDAAEPPIPDA